MSWVDELGERKFTDKESKKMVAMLKLVGSMVEDEDGEFDELMNEVIDTAILNLTKIKASMKES